MMREEYARGARGIAIVAVVCSEVLRRIHDAGFLQDDRLDRFMMLIQYTMFAVGYPCLFFLFGLKAVASLNRSRAGFARMTLYGVVYPYLLWSLLQMGLEWSIAQYANHGFPVAEFARIAWSPVDQFWFLYALFVCHLVAWATVWIGAANRNRVMSAINRALLALLAIVCAVLATRTEWGFVTLILWGLTFFLAGVLLAPILHAWFERTSAGPLALAAAALVFVVAILWGQRDGSFLGAFTLPANFAGIVTALLVAKVLIKRRPGYWLRMLGTAWMPIYLLHVIVTAVVWNGLLAAEIDWSVVHTLVGAVAGIAVPYAIYRLSKRFKCTQLVGFEADRTVTEPEMRQRAPGDYRTQLERPLP